MFAILQVVVPVEAIGCALVEVGTECHDAVFFAVYCDFELCLIGLVGAVDVAIDGNSDAFKVDDISFGFGIAKSFNSFGKQLWRHSNEALFQADGFRLLHFDADFFVGDFAAVLFDVFQSKVEALLVDIVERHCCVGEVAVFYFAKVRHPLFGNVAVANHCCQNACCRGRVAVGVLSASG